MIHLFDLMLGEAGGVFDRRLKTKLGLTARDNIEPIAVAPACAVPCAAGRAVSGDAAVV